MELILQTNKYFHDIPCDRATFFSKLTLIKHNNTTLNLHDIETNLKMLMHFIIPTNEIGFYLEIGGLSERLVESN